MKTYKAYITISTKNNKGGEIIFFKVPYIYEAEAWAKGYKSYIDSWKKKRNFLMATLEVFDGPERKHFSFL